MVPLKKAKPKIDTERYVPTDQEKTIIERQCARFKDQPPVPRLKVSKNGKLRKLGPDHPDAGVAYALLNEALGTVDFDFVIDFIGQLASVSTLHGEVDEGKLNFLLSVVKSIKPQDHLESMLVAQMGAVHLAAMKLVRQLSNAEHLTQQDSAARAFTKLVQIYATQMETLKRYRTGGEQKVTVQHVSVNEGGQAIVGNVTQTTAEVAPQPSAKSTPALKDDRTAPMEVIEETAREKVPLKYVKKNGSGSSS
jgi:hypothetical protein